MQYRNSEKNSDNLSILGFGCMRFPRKGGAIDTAETEKLIKKAVEAGINYFDTAYIYPGSEEVLGEILQKNNLRDRVKIATKLPHYLIKDSAGMEKCFNQQLKRLRTDHVDYYLMHMLPDTAVWERLKALGIENWLEEKKKSGQIKKVGFSYHGDSSRFIELLDAYGWDFCQIQYNYLDENSQAGRRGLTAAAERGLPVVIMEPLRGGKLANGLPEKAREVFERAEPRRSPAEWAFRWLWNQKEVTVVLSGMNSVEMLEENICAANTARVGELGGKEEIFEEALKAINEKMRVGCTGCGYCMPCPKGVDIPGAFRCLNVKAQDGAFAGLREYFMCTAMKRKKGSASLCVECGKCEKHCPQGIEIRKELKTVRKELETPIYKAAAWFAKTFIKL